MKTYQLLSISVIVLVLACSISPVLGVSWWNITDIGLRNLPVNEFASITAEELGSIPPRSFSWILIAQISSIPPEAFSGANSSHLSGLTDSCRGLTLSQVNNIRGPAFAGITSRCFNEFTTSTYTGLTNEHVINFSESVCRGMSQIRSIPDFAFVSITPQCVSWLSGTSCRALSGKMLASISRTSLESLTSNCLNNFPDNIFAQSTAELISALPSSACSGMRSQLLANMFAPAANGFTSECVAQFTWGACGGLIAPIVQNLSPRGVAGLTSRCVFDSPETAYSTMPGELFAHVNPVACQGFTRGHLRNMPTIGAAYLTPQCVGNFSGGSNSACGGLTADFVALLTPQAVSGIGVNCMWSIRAETFASWTPQQYAAISPQGCSGLTAHQASFFPLTAAPAFSSDCVRSFGFSSTSVCAGLRADFLRAMPPEKFRYFSPGCMGSLLGASLQQLTSDHLRNFNPEGCSGFRLPHVQNLPPTAASGLTAACLRAFSTGFWGACSGLNQPFVGNMSVEVFSAFNATCIRDTTRRTFGSINSARVKQITPQAFAGFDVLHMLEMSEAVHFEMSVAQVQHLSPRGFSGFRPAPLGALVEGTGLPLVNLLTAAQTALYPPDFVTVFKSYIPSKVPLMTSWGEVSNNLAAASWLQITLLQSPAPLSGEHIAQLTPSTTAGLRADQIRAISYAHFDQFTPEQAQNFTADMTAAFSGVQVQALLPNTFGNISLAGISGLSPSVIPSITVDQIAQLTRVQMLQMSCPQLNAFTDAQLQMFTPIQTTNYQAYLRSCAFRIPTTQNTPLHPTMTPTGTAIIGESPASFVPLLVGLLVPGLVILTISILLVIYVRRRQAQRANGNIQNMIGKPYYVEGSGWMQIIDADDENVMMVPYNAMN